MLKKIDAYWRAANYLSVGQIYLKKNPLLKEPLQLEHLKPRLLGHWGTTPGLNFIYAHMNRLIKEQDLNILFVTGPGHGAPGILANTYLEGSYSERYPEISRDLAGMQRFFKQFSWPGGIPSHTAPQTPGSIHEGGELGYSLLHAYGAVFDNPDLIACCVVGDGEAETGPLAASWHSHRFLNPKTDGVVLPILHLNGYKIAGPTLLAKMPPEELTNLFMGYGYQPYFVEGDDPEKMHALMSETLDRVYKEIRINRPMIVLRSPKGWTGPKVVDGLQVEGTCRAHQVPLSNPRDNPAHLAELERWLKSYRPEELFDEQGCLVAELAELAPKGQKRMGMNPHSDGSISQDLILPDFHKYAVTMNSPGNIKSEATHILGEYLRDVMSLNLPFSNFRVVGPDETASNKLSAIFEVSPRVSGDHPVDKGRVLEVLSEHLCEGWLEGYVLTGRHGFFSCYEAFIHIIDSMFNQHAKWLKVSQEVPWRHPIPSLNILLTSHVWRQDHNGFSHQDPGFIDHVVNKKAGIVRVYLPPDANTLLSVANHCLRSRNYVNVIVAGKQPEWQWLDMPSALKHCQTGIGIWEWASNSEDSEPDLVMACAGDVPTLETLAAVSILRQEIPQLKIRVVNIIDLMTLQPKWEHPHGLSDENFDALFTKNKPVIFAFHGYPWLIHRLTYRRHNHENMHVRGYKEEGSTTTPFDMAVQNNIDRFQLAHDALTRLPHIQSISVREMLLEKLRKHKSYIHEHGEDMPEIKNWKWTV